MERTFTTPLGQTVTVLEVKDPEVVSAITLMNIDVTGISSPPDELSLVEEASITPPTRSATIPEMVKDSAADASESSSQIEESDDSTEAKGSIVDEPVPALEISKAADHISDQPRKFSVVKSKSDSEIQTMLSTKQPTSKFVEPSSPKTDETLAGSSAGESSAKEGENISILLLNPIANTSEMTAHTPEVVVEPHENDQAVLVVDPTASASDTAPPHKRETSRSELSTRSSWTTLKQYVYRSFTNPISSMSEPDDMKMTTLENAIGVNLGSISPAATELVICKYAPSPWRVTFLTSRPAGDQVGLIAMTLMLDACSRTTVPRLS